MFRLCTKLKGLKPELKIFNSKQIHIFYLTFISEGANYKRRQGILFVISKKLRITIEEESVGLVWVTCGLP
ncbi:hypothetical protein GBA52_027413 [Prunus armeniaca]|nr:hypothetical protein GBA52_027413 [Prunus armeniaca]